MKHVASTFLLIFLACNFGIAQETVSATATGTFSVTSSLTVTKLADLNFGDLVAGVDIAIESASAEAAQFLISGSANTSIQVVFTFPTELTCGSNAINFKDYAPVYNTIADVASASKFKHSGLTTTSDDGNLYIWAGGKVTTNKNQAAGMYTGVIEITVTEQ
jgi:hypothetical protein